MEENSKTTLFHLQIMLKIFKNKIVFVLFSIANRNENMFYFILKGLCCTTQIQTKSTKYYSPLMVSVHTEPQKFSVKCYKIQSIEMQDWLSICKAINL